ncbi:MAG: hypothetical protein Q9213_005059 [Squamulea squamosa]
MRFGLYAGVSSALAVGAIARACLERPNFYSSTVYIAQSNACLFILTNLALLSTYSVMLGLQKAFYGPLRPVEIEQLWEKAWFALTETALAMTIFRDEGKPPNPASDRVPASEGSSNLRAYFGGWFLFMFTFLLISKVWNWLAEGRVEILEQQPPANPRLFHTRLSAALSLSVVFNVYMLRFCASSVLQQARPNMMVMFAFEFAVLTILSLSTTARYTLSLYETAVIKRQIAHGRQQLRRRAENPLSEEEANDTEIDAAGWEEKGQWVFYLDIATDFFKLVLYLTFFCVLCMFYGMPIHIIRDVALTIRSFYKRIRDFVQYKQATRDMNARYPDATAEEILREDVCIICRENMTVWQNPTTGGAPEARQPVDERQRAKKLPCGHLLHFACLRSWLERQQICPTCRTPVLGNNLRPLNPNQEARPNGRGAPGANNPPPAGPHVYTFGPFRLVVGARQNNNNHLHNTAAAAAAAAAAIAAGNPPQAALQPRNPSTSSSATISAQLNQIEQQISREMSHLSHLSEQLQVLRALQTELARTRGAQGVLGNHGPTPTYQLRQPSLQQSVQAYHEVPLGHGQQNLPAGMTIPEGWSLHALHRIPGNAYHSPQALGSEEASQVQQLATNNSQAQPSPRVQLNPGNNDPGQSSDVGGNQGTSQVNDHGSSKKVEPPGFDQGACSVQRSDESLSAPPAWGFADERELAEESSGVDNRDKGKGKAATIEDAADDADA